MSSAPHHGYAIAMTAAFFLGAIAFGVAVRPVLRNPIMPRWLAVLVVVVTSNLGITVMRGAQSQYEYGTTFREGHWVYVWFALWTVGFCGALTIGNRRQIESPDSGEVADTVAVERLVHTVNTEVESGRHVGATEDELHRHAAAPTTPAEQTEHVATAEAESMRHRENTETELDRHNEASS